jgi:hypothetical protein
MLEKLMKLYVFGMEYDVRSPMPHLVGPPGCGKSTYVEQLADLLGVDLHLINVSRLSPLDVEGVQMPHGIGDEMALRMLPATFWTSLKDGDIILFDEFLRGFPEVYNSLLDIFTSRRVGAHRLPKVFMIGASNSVVAYDAALEDRLLHIMVPDPRKSKREKDHIAKLLVEYLGLMPDMTTCAEMTAVLDEEILPTYDLLDSFGKKGQKVTAKGLSSGTSLRNLIGQAQLRLVTSSALRELIAMNNHWAMQQGKHQFVLLLNGTRKYVPNGYEVNAKKLRDNPRLSPVQARNLNMNLQLIQMERAKTSEEEDE